MKSWILESATEHFNNANRLSAQSGGRLRVEAAAALMPKVRFANGAGPIDNRAAGYDRSRISSHAALRRGQPWRRRGRSAGSLALDNRELQRKVLAISVRRPRFVVDLHVEKPFLDHHVSHDLLEAALRLAFKRPTRPEVSAVCPEPFAELAPTGPR